VATGSPFHDPLEQNDSSRRFHRLEQVRFILPAYRWKVRQSPSHFSFQCFHKGFLLFYVRNPHSQ
jgi:hypothetical protein